MAEIEQQRILAAFAGLRLLENGIPRRAGSGPEPPPDGFSPSGMAEVTEGQYHELATASSPAHNGFLRSGPARFIKFCLIKR